MMKSDDKGHKGGGEMIHYLDEDFLNCMLALKESDEECYLIWQVILSDDTLCPILRKEKIDVYYRGFMLFSITGDGITRNPDDFTNELYAYDVPEDIPKEDFLDYLPYMKQSMDLWMGSRNNSLYEREFRQLLMRENNSKKAGDLSDYFIVDMEHQYKKDGPVSDLVGLIMERGKRQREMYKMSMINLYYSPNESVAA